MHVLPFQIIPENAENVSKPALSFPNNFYSLQETMSGQAVAETQSVWF